MKKVPANLPVPSTAALAHSQQLRHAMQKEIIAQGGMITFTRFMELALYAPALGYYSAGSHKLGEQGDFMTAPEITPLFARCLARQCQQVLTECKDGSILELGGGSGKLALDLLLALEQQNCLPQTYYLLEVSADLRQRQQQLLQTQAPHLIDKIQWLDQLPATPFNGVIIANEVLDAMPVQRFHASSAGIQEFYVACENEEFVWRLGTLNTPTAAEQIKHCFTELPDEEYISEINPLLPAFINSLSQCLQKGLILLVDYGFPRHEYYHPDRSMGTLMCHYRHHAHVDPLILVGLQDITAHVDFTAVAEAAVAADLQVAGFTNQAAFLLNCGLLDLAVLEQGDNAQQQMQVSRQIQLLTSPAEMGELFKVLALTKNLDDSLLLGFYSHDQRARL